MITAQNNTHFKPPGIYSEHTRTKHEIFTQSDCGIITGGYVLYRGEDTAVEGIRYQNVEQFLCTLK